MRGFNKYTAMLLMAAVLFTLLPCVPALAAAAQPGNFIEKLEALGVLTVGESALLESDSPLSRGAFTRLMVRLSGIAPETIIDRQYALPFSDVNPNDEIYTWLCAAYEIGLADGTSSELFRPNDPVTREMAAKMLVTVLGYKQLAELRGGYPTGYQILASQLKLFSGCGSLAEIDGAAAAVLLENALDTPYFRETAVGTANTFQSDSAHTLLQERFFIYQTEGVLDGTENTTLLTGDSPVKHGFVTIDQTRYAVGETSAEALFGYHVEGYWRGEQGEERTLLYVAPTRKNEILQMDAENLLSASAERFTYEDVDGDPETVNLSPRASFLYNGKQTPFSSELLRAECGNITLIDNNDDGAYDVLIMTAYRTIVVSGASAHTHTVTDYLGGKAVELDPQSGDYRVHMTLDGAPVTVADLQPWDVLSYAESPEDGKVLKTALVRREKATGTVNAVSLDDKMVEINGVEYRASAAVMEKIKAGDEGAFYIDAFARVVAASNERDVVYGFVKAGLKKSLDRYYLKIFTENNRWVELPLRSKLQYNGVSGTPAADAYSALLQEEKFKPQLITYRVSAEREINELNTAQDIPVGSAGEEAALQAGTFRKSLALSSANYRNYAGSAAFGDSFCVASAKIFILPGNPAEAPDEAFNAGSASLLVHDVRYTNIAVYDIDEMRYAKACTVDSKAGSVENNSGTQPFMVVTGINDAVDDYGEVVYAVHGLYQGGTSAVYAETEAVDTIALQKGDVVQFGVDETGNVCAVSRCYSAKDGFKQKGITGDPYSVLTVLRAQVKNISTEKGRFVLDYGSGQGVYRLGDAPVYLYDPVHGRGMVGTAGDIAVGDYVFVAARYLSGATIVVFKEY